MSVKIIVDSTADLTPEVAQQVKTVPLTIHFGEKQYVSGVDIDSKKFYEMLVESDVLPTTSQPTPYAFSQVFQEVVDAGDTAVCLTVSSKLSGTYQSASIAAEEFPGKIFVVDTLTVAIGGGILAEYALQLANSGMEAEELAQALLAQRQKVRVLALVDTLEYLKKGGRISSTVDFTKPLMLGYTGLSDALLQKYIADSAALWEGQVENLPVSIVSSVVGTHVGPGAVAVAFFARNAG